MGVRKPADSPPERQRGECPVNQLDQLKEVEPAPEPSAEPVTIEGARAREEVIRRFQLDQDAIERLIASYEHSIAYHRLGSSEHASHRGRIAELETLLSDGQNVSTCEASGSDLASDEPGTSAG